VRVHQNSFFAMARAVALAVVIGGFAAAPAWSDGDPAEQNLTQKEYAKITEIAPAPGNQPAIAAPVTAHDLNDAERAEMERMNAVRVLGGKAWKRLSPEEREARIRTLRDTMPGASLMLIVPSGELWAIPPGEDNVNFHDIVDRKIIRLWTPEEKAAMPVAVGKGPSRNDGSSDLSGFASAPQPAKKP